MKKENYGLDGNKPFWYDNNYNSLGTKWLKDSLLQLNPTSEFVFVSLSANKGYYERDVYNELQENYNPTFIISDIEANNFNDKTISFNNFYYIDGNQDAAEINLNCKADIILDCKGALWHLIDKSNKIDIIKLLENYIELLKNDNSVLMIDSYCIRNYPFFIFNNLNTYFFRTNYKKSKVHIFQEFSTYKYLLNILSKKKCKSLFIHLKSYNNDRYFPLLKNMRLSTISKKDIRKLIYLIDQYKDKDIKSRKKGKWYEQLLIATLIILYFIWPVLFIILFLLVI